MRKLVATIFLAFVMTGLTFVATPGAEAATKCSRWKVDGPVAVKACTGHHPTAPRLIRHFIRIKNIGVQDIRVSSFGAAYINGHPAGTFGGDDGDLLRPGNWRQWSATSTRIRGKKYSTKAWGKDSSRPELPYTVVGSPAITG